MPEYGDVDYWNKRYAASSDDPFDWLQTYDSMKGYIQDYVKKTDKILIIGCGNADFSSDMYDDGYQNLVNIDISHVVIEQMTEKNASRPHMQYLVMDATKMTFPDQHFDAIIDKSTIDAIVCAAGSDVLVCKMVMEAQRVLKVGGVYLTVSLHSIKKMISYFECPALDFAVANCEIENPRWNPEEGQRCRTHSLFLCKRIELPPAQRNVFPEYLGFVRAAMVKLYEEGDDEDFEDEELSETESGESDAGEGQPGEEEGYDAVDEKEDGADGEEENERVNNRTQKRAKKSGKFGKKQVKLTEEEVRDILEDVEMDEIKKLIRQIVFFEETGDRKKEGTDEVVGDRDQEERGENGEVQDQISTVETELKDLEKKLEERKEQQSSVLSDSLDYFSREELIEFYIRLRSHWAPKGDEEVELPPTPAPSPVVKNRGAKNKGGVLVVREEEEGENREEEEMEEGMAYWSDSALLLFKRERRRRNKPFVVYPLPRRNRNRDCVNVSSTSVPSPSSSSSSTSPSSSSSSSASASSPSSCLSSSCSTATPSSQMSQYMDTVIPASSSSTASKHTSRQNGTSSSSQLHSSPLQGGSDVNVFN